MASNSFGGFFNVYYERVTLGSYKKSSRITSAGFSIVYNGVEIFVDDREKTKAISHYLRCANKYMTDDIYMHLV